MDGGFGGLSVVTAGDFHQIIRYSASGSCLDKNVTTRKVQKTRHEHTSTRAHEHRRSIICLRFFLTGSKEW